MPRANQKQLEEFWSFADKDGNGSLCIHEFRKAVLHYHEQGGGQGCPPTPCQIVRMFHDIGDDDTLTKDEYITALEKQERTKDNLEAIFKAQDADGSGTLNKGEIMQILKDSGEFNDEAMDKAFSKVDEDGDGKISLDEFMAWI